MRYTLGYDKELAAGYVFTAEYMYSRVLNQLFYQNIALGGVQGVDRYGRVMYGPAPLQPVTPHGLGRHALRLESATLRRQRQMQAFLQRDVHGLSPVLFRMHRG
mgnify:CR=1 FL=1